MREPSSSLKPPFKYWKTMMMSSWAFSSPGRGYPSPSVFLQRTGSPLIILMVSFGPSPVCLHFSWIVGTRTGRNSQVWSDKCWVEWDDQVSISTSKALAFLLSSWLELLFLEENVTQIDMKHHGKLQKLMNLPALCCNLSNDTLHLTEASQSFILINI